MAPDSLFGPDESGGGGLSRDPFPGDTGEDSGLGRGDKPGVAETPSEGVRVLGADEVVEVAERAETVRRRGPEDKKYGDRPEPPPDDVTPAMRFPLGDADPGEMKRPRPVPVTSRRTREAADGDHEPAAVMSVGPSEGADPLPHWTAPPTGEVPAAIAGDDNDEPQDDASARWRDERIDRRGDPAGFADLASGEGALGALDERDRPLDEDLLTFSDLDVPDAPPPKAAPLQTGPAATDDGPRWPDEPEPNEFGPTGPRDSARASRSSARPGAGPGRDRGQSVLVGVAVASVALVFALVGAFTKWQWFPVILVAGAIVGSMAEFFTVSGRAGFRPIRAVGFLAGVAAPIAAYNAGESGMMLVLFLAVGASMSWYLFGVGTGRAVANIAISLAGVVYVGLLGSYGALILRAGPWANVPTSATVQGVSYFILIALGTTTYDAVGYLVGSKIGRTALSAASPNKTSEGLAAGMIGSILVVVGVGALGLAVENIGQALILGAIIAVVAPMGDLFESMIKRDLGVKDMGNMLPSHGGVLDRCDGYLFTLPAAYYTLRVLGLIA
jgi:phosphatidate cytidylyltransferase